MASFTRNRDSQNRPASPPPGQAKDAAASYPPPRQDMAQTPITTAAMTTSPRPYSTTSGTESPQPRAQRERASSRVSLRPLSMIQTYQPPMMDVAQDTLP